MEARNGPARVTSQTGDRSLLVTIVETVAAARELDPVEMPPLSSVVDTDALERLFAQSPDEDESRATLTFVYAECTVAVHADGTVQTVPADARLVDAIR